MLENSLSKEYLCRYYVDAMWIVLTNENKFNLHESVKKQYVCNMILRHSNMAYTLDFDLEKSLQIIINVLWYVKNKSICKNLSVLLIYRLIKV